MFDVFRFADPWALLIAVPTALGLVWALRRRARATGRLRLPGAGVALQLPRSVWVRLEPVLPWLRGIALLLVVVALARPQSGSRIEEVSTFGVDIVIALDISGSMRAEDFQPDNRLAVAKRTAAEFVSGRPADRIGLVIFGSVATTRCPLTLDHELLQLMLEQVEIAPLEQQETAIGMGLATAANRLRESDAESRVIVLVTDGKNTAGEVGPRAAAEAAAALGIKVYTVGVGSNDEVPVPVQTGLGVRYRYVRLELDEALLQEIAETTNGRYFRATDADTLAGIFDTIDGLERTEIESQVRVLYRELFPWLLGPALGLVLLERLLEATRLRRIP